MSLPGRLAALAALASLASLASLAAMTSIAATGCGGIIDRCSDEPCPPVAAPSQSSPAETTASPPSSAASPRVEPDCPPPYMGEAPDGRCVWSCGEGTRPGYGSQCVCSEGTTEAGVDAFGRRICR